jgi:hypothetical protein
MTSTPVTLLALATAVPTHQLEQSAVADFARRAYARSFIRFPKLADASLAAVRAGFFACQCGAPRHAHPRREPGVGLGPAGRARNIGVDRGNPCQ